MSRQLSSCLLAVLLSATSVFAQFEGVLEMKMTITAKDGRERAGGTITIALAKTGMREELTLQGSPAVSGKTVVLCKTDTPNTSYRLDDANRTYTEIDLSQPAENQEPEKAKWTVKKLGQKKLLGYHTQRVLATPNDGTGQSMELWLATDFLDYETYRKLQAATGGNPRGDDGLAQALKDAGTEGMPLKVVVTTREEGKVTINAVKVEKKALPASTFEVPADYTKAINGIVIVTGPEAEAMKARQEAARKKMEAQLKKLSPEQRALLKQLLDQPAEGSP